VVRQVQVNCYVCGSSEERQLLTILRPGSDGTEGEYRVARCSICRFLYVSPRPAEEELFALYARHVAYFRDDYEPLSRELPVLRRVLKEIQRFVASGAVLDVGCGRGELLDLARKAGFQACGCDLQRSRAIDPEIEVHLGALRSAKFTDGRFDCIVMRNTLEHLFDPREELAFCRRLLRRNGVLYLKVPNADYEAGWKCRVMFGKKNVFGPPWHLNYFTQPTLSRFLQQAGFQVEDWLIEEPTPDTQPLRDFVQKTCFGIFRTARAISFGKLFPKPLLTCIARKG
jgi:SAM-dependent methyltransferase